VLVLRATIYALSSSIPPLTYNHLGSPLADLSRSHPLTVIQVKWRAMMQSLLFS
jgi:hypothetical protein